MELVHEFTFTAVLNEAVPIGEGPFGNRRIREVVSGEVTGERINGKVGSGGDDEHYFRTAPRLETGDPRYHWVNRTVFVARGRLHPGPVVEYEVFRVA